MSKVSLKKSKPASLYLKGFAMGMADIIPGVSGGTIAFITGIYEDLINAISSLDHNFIKNILSFNFKGAFKEIPLNFLIPLFFGIICAILLTSRVVHYLLDNYSIYTWAFFFGLIISSVIFLGKEINGLFSPKNLLALFLGTGLGYIIVSLVPVNTPNNYFYTFFAGMIAICAMILPGISGAFLLLILGKYAYVTGALKNPFLSNNFFSIIIFCMGCLLGLISFSKFIKWALNRHHSVMMAILTGFMIGSLKKVWPWKIALETKVIRDKTYILKEASFFPNLDMQFYIALAFFILGFIIVQVLERSNRGVSSAG